MISKTKRPSSGVLPKAFMGRISKLELIFIEVIHEQINNWSI